MNKRHPHANMIDEMLLSGYDISFKKVSVYIIKRIGDQIKYQVFNEKENKGILFDSVKEATNEFLLLKKRMYG